jgi:hypothetical protein
MQPDCSRKSKQGRMPMGEGVVEEEVVMLWVEEEVVGVVMIVSRKIHSNYIAMTIFVVLAISTMISPMKRSLRS